MNILRLLSEEVFDFSAEQMTTVKAKKLKEQLCGEFAQIFQLCNEVLQNSTSSGLMAATLKALLRFLKWIPLGFIFETNIIPLLRDRCFSVPQHRNVALSCFTEIGSLTISAEYDQHFYRLFEMVMESIKAILPADASECHL